MEQPSFELPPQPENLEQTPADRGERLVSSPEQTGNQAGVATPSFQAQPQQPAPTPSPQAQPQQPAPTNIVVKTPVLTDDGLEANNVDLIEKEWVDKAKHIVAKTQDDPFVQKNEISKVKAEYIQKRFKKTIKADEAAT